MVRRAVTGLAAACLALAASGCGVRLETETPQWPSPDAATIERDAFAEEVAALRRAAAAADSSRSGQTLVAPAVAAAADEVLDLLGGVYVAYPDASPSPAPAPDSLADAIIDARQDAAHIRATTSDADIALLANSLDLTLAVASFASAYADARAAGAPPLGVAERAAPGGEAAGFAPPDFVTGLGEPLLRTLVLAHDQARFAYETIAARESGGQRTAALTRAGLHAQRAELLATLVDDDPREALYPLTAADLSGPDARRAFEVRLELAIAEAYASGLPGIAPADAPWVINGAFDAYAAALVIQGVDDDTAPSLPVLPGIQR